ncbi:uncharacterized protein LOC144445387 [Glandiceps talaboti]
MIVTWVSNVGFVYNTLCGVHVRTLIFTTYLYKARMKTYFIIMHFITLLYIILSCVSTGYGFQCPQDGSLCYSSGGNKYTVEENTDVNSIKGTNLFLKIPSVDPHADICLFFTDARSKSRIIRKSNHSGRDQNDRLQLSFEVDKSGNHGLMIQNLSTVHEGRYQFWMNSAVPYFVSDNILTVLESAESDVPFSEEVWD